MTTAGETAAVALLLAPEEASFGTGQTLLVDGGLAITDSKALSFLGQVGARSFSGQL